MFKDFDVNIIDKYLHDKFPIVFGFEFDGILLLKGSTVKNLIMSKYASKDLDFNLLTQGEGNVLEFIKKYNLEVIRQDQKGYRVKYKGTTIDIYLVHDLYYGGYLSTDYLFYDVFMRTLIPIGINKSIRENTIYDYYYQNYYCTKRRYKSAKEFIRFFNHKKRVKIKHCYNRPYRLFLAFLKNPKKLFKKR